MWRQYLWIFPCLFEKMTQFRSRVIRKTNYLFYSQSGNKILPWHMHSHLAEDGNLVEFVPPGWVVPVWVWGWSSSKETNLSCQINSYLQFHIVYCEMWSNIKSKLQLICISENCRLILPCHPAIMPRLVFLPGNQAPNSNFEMTVSLLILAIGPCKFQWL